MVDSTAYGGQEAIIESSVRQYARKRDREIMGSSCGVDNGVAKPGVYPCKFFSLRISVFRFSSLSVVPKIH